MVTLTYKINEKTTVLRIIMIPW